MHLRIDTPTKTSIIQETNHGFNNHSNPNHESEVITLQIGDQTFCVSKQNLVKRSNLFATYFGYSVRTTSNNVMTPTLCKTHNDGETLPEKKTSNRES